MKVSTYFLIGNMTVPSSWVALIIAFVIAYSLVRFKFEKRVAEKMSDLIFYFIIVWKFSVLITNFETVIQSPLSIIYFHGGRVGIFLGLFVVGIKVLIEINKNRLNKDDVVVLFLGSVIIQVVYQLTMVLLNEGALLVQLMTLVIFIPFAVFAWLAIKRAGWFTFSTVTFICSNSSLCEFISTGGYFRDICYCNSYDEFVFCGF